ncbi:MAG: 6-pyruvoyl-tetrahydropterin synthase-related protein [Terracidiphilus sp.]
MKSTDTKNPDQPSPSLNKPGRRRFTGPALILFAAFVAIVPQLIRGNSCGHDFDVHLVSWLDCLNAWRHGIPYPHWTPSPNYGAGEPRFVFYPPLTWMLGAALGAVLPWNLTPIVLTFLILAATGLATRALALEALDDLPATLAGCVSIFSGFTLFTAYERCAFPEFAGGFWLPLIILFALRDRPTSGRPILSRFARKGESRVPHVPRIWGHGSDPELTSDPSRSLARRAPLATRILDGSTVPLALALAGAWLSNLPLGVIAGYLLAGVALLWAPVNKSWAPLLRAAVATVLGLGLAAIYWVPAALERHWVDIRQATDDPGYNFENNWLFSRHANPLLALHDVILRQVSWIAVSMIAVAFAAVIVCYFRGSLPRPEKNRWWIPIAAIPIVVLFLLFPISRPVWHMLPQMPFLQYPWRWLEAVEAPMAIFFVAAIWPSSRNARRSRILALSACAVLFIAATVYAGTTFFQVCYPEDTVASTLISYRAGAGFEGMYEYEPPNGDVSQIATGLPDACLVSDPSIVLGKPDPDDPDANPAWTPDQNTCQATFAEVGGNQTNPEHRNFVAAIPHSGYLVLRLLRYPAWTLRLNGQPLNADRLAALPQRGDGLIAFAVPQGPIHLTIDWTITPDVLAGRWICIISVLLLAGLWFYELRCVRTRLK